jgi:hypothetical protein
VRQAHPVPGRAGVGDAGDVDGWLAVQGLPWRSGEGLGFYIKV